MTHTIRTISETPVDTIRISVAVRYGDEDMPMDFPFRAGDMWTVDVDLATGKIKNWPGPAFDLYMKVCDEGAYYLFSNGQEVASIVEDYVPNGVVPGEYGDYIDFKIAQDGTITNWPKVPDLSAFDEVP
jgi:hypothetical protein